LAVILLLLFLLFFLTWIHDFMISKLCRIRTLTIYRYTTDTGAGKR
jgi:hypothetical protein